MKEKLNPTKNIPRFKAMKVVGHVTLGVTCRGVPFNFVHSQNLHFSNTVISFCSHRETFRKPFYGETELTLSSRFCSSWLKASEVAGGNKGANYLMTTSYLRNWIRHGGRRSLELPWFPERDGWPVPLLLSFFVLLPLPGNGPMQAGSHRLSPGSLIVPRKQFHTQPSAVLFLVSIHQAFVYVDQRFPWVFVFSDFSLFPTPPCFDLVPPVGSLRLFIISRFQFKPLSL